MKTYLGLLFLFSILGQFTVTGGRGETQSTLDVAAIDEFVNAQLAAQRVPGVALAIVRGDQVLYVQGYGTAAMASQSHRTPSSSSRRLANQSLRSPSCSWSKRTRSISTPRCNAICRILH